MKIITIFSVFLSTLFSHNIFSAQLPCKQLTTFVQEPHLVAWLGDDQVFLGGKNGFEIIDTTHNSSITQKECAKEVYDIAVNKTKTLYAISSYGKIECYLLKNHIPQWEFVHGQTVYTPITFNSQDENQLIYCSFIRGYAQKNLQNVPHDNNLLYFHSSTMHPISCQTSETKVIYFTKNANDFKTIRTSNWDSPFRMSSQINDSLTEIRYTIDGKHLILNFQDYLEIRKTSKSYPCIAFIPTNSCIAFECCDNQRIAVLTKDSIISYYSYCPNDLIAQTKLPLSVEQSIEEQNTEDDTPTKRLSISSNGTKLLVALPDRCIVIPVPLAVICGPEEAKRLFTLFYLLRPFI